MPNSNICTPQKPSFWQDVHRSIWRQLELAEILRDALVAQNDPQPFGPIIALRSLESYIAAAKRQQRRIARAMVVNPKSSLFDDTHFYLIAWSRIAKLARFIRQRTRFCRVGLVLRRYHADLDCRIAARDHLEHFEERLPGGPNAKLLSVPGDLFNLSQSLMTYGGKTLEIGKPSMKLLAGFVEEFRSTLMYDAVELLVELDLDRIKRHLDRAASEIQIARVTKTVFNQMKGRVPTA